MIMRVSSCVNSLAESTDRPLVLWHSSCDRAGMPRHRAPDDREIYRVIADVQRIQLKVADLLKRLRDERTEHRKLTVDRKLSRKGSANSNDDSVH
jgi:hypothetical protein